MKRRVVFVVAGILSILAASSAFAMSPEAARNFAGQLAYLSSFKNALTPAQQKVSPQILLAIAAERDEGVRNSLSMPMRSSLQENFVGDTVDCDLSADVSDALLFRIVELGGTVKSASVRFKSVHAELPKVAIEKLALESAVKSIEPVIKPEFHRVNVSEGVIAHKVDSIQGSYGFIGRGVKVGVMSDSIRHLDEVQASGDLPDVTVLDGLGGISDDDDDGEGTAMLEIVHDMAPGASLYFATAYDTMAEMAENILALADAGCKVIVDDVSYYGESAFQDGVIAQAVNTAVERGCIVFSSAGNSGNLDSGESGTWEGDFASLTNVSAFAGIDFSASGYDAIHDFGTADGCNGIVPEYSSRSIYLHWSDPVGVSSNDYDLFLYDRNSGDIYRSSTAVQSGTGNPRESVSYPGSYRENLAVAVLRKKGAASRFLRIDTHRGRLEVGTDGQTVGHNGCEKGISVGAAEAPIRAFVAGDSVEDFSSDGPRRIFYTPEGVAITPDNFLSTGGRLLPKVDFTAADGVSCATPGFASFYGTSAAAPHAAAIAALVLEVNPSLTRDGVFAIMRETALSTNGWNRTTGWGILDADACVRRAVSLYMQNPRTVVFDANGGEVEGGSVYRWTLESGASLGELPVPTRRFYAFDGWFTAAVGGTSVSAGTVVDGNASYYAHWTQLPTCIITFDPQGGTVEETTLEVLKDSVVGDLPIPYRRGYLFVGWFTAGGVSFTGDSSTSADITLYAHWEELPFTVGGGADWTVRTNGIWQSGAIGNSTSTWAEVTVAVPCVISFDWKTSSEARYDTLSFYVDGVLAAGPISGVMSAWSNVTYAAVGSPGTRTLRWTYSKDRSMFDGEDCGWVRNFSVNTNLEYCTVTLDANGGILDWTEMTAISGVGVGTLPVPVRIGYVFAGWYTAAEGGEKVTASTVVNGDTIFYAHWTEIVYSWRYTVDAAGNAVITSGSSFSKAVSITSPSGATLSGVLRVPEEIDGHTVVSIGLGAFYSCSSLTEIILPETVTSIDNYAFYGCTSLQNVTLPESVTSIGNYAFDNCTSLQDVTLPESVTNIGNFAFAYCTSLEMIEIPSATENVGEGVFASCASLAVITVADGNGYYASQDGILYDSGFTVLVACGNGKGGDVVIPETVTRINAYAFYSNSRITSLSLPGGLEQIGNYAFYGCNALTTLTLPESMDAIGAYAFYSCVNLTNVTVLSGIVSLSNYAFANNARLLIASLPRTLERQVLSNDTIFSGCAEGFSIIYADSPDTVYRTITFDANGGDMDETTRTVVSLVGTLPVLMREGYIHLGWFTAREGGELVTALTEVTGDMTLYAHWYFVPFIFGGNANWTYEGDDVWRSGTIGHSQTTWIETTVTGPCVVSFDWMASSESGWDKLHFYVDGTDVVSAISGNMSSWSAVEYSIEDTSTHKVRWAYTKDFSGSYYSDCGWIRNYRVIGFDEYGFLIDRGVLLAYQGAGGDIEIPAGVTSIAEDVFAENETIFSVTFPESLKSIGDGSFYGCSGLEDITVPASVTNIGYYAFGYCSSLRAVRYLGNKPRTVASKYGSGCYEGTPDTLTSFVRRDRLASWADVSTGALPTSWEKRLIAFWDQTPVTKATPVAVEHTWLVERWDALQALYPSLGLPVTPGDFDAFAAVVAQPTGKTDASGNGLCVWHDYVAGTDPSNPDSCFTVYIDGFDRQGLPVVKWNPILSETETARRRYIIYGAKQLGGSAWRNMSDVPGTEKRDYRFFRGTVEMR